MTPRVDTMDEDNQAQDDNQITLDKLQTDLENAMNNWKRTAADFENYKKRKEAENKELAGYKIIYGILDCFEPLVLLSAENFNLLLESCENVSALQGKGLDLEWRLFNRLPKKYVEAYKFDRDTKFEACYTTSPDEFYQFEWFYRCHLIVDYISGMTDNFALETYRLLYGIKI